MWEETRVLRECTQTVALTWIPFCVCVINIITKCWTRQHYLKTCCKYKIKCGRERTVTEGTATLDTSTLKLPLYQVLVGGEGHSFYWIQPRHSPTMGTSNPVPVSSSENAGKCGVAGEKGKQNGPLLYASLVLWPLSESLSSVRPLPWGQKLLQPDTHALGSCSQTTSAEHPSHSSFTTVLPTPFPNPPTHSLHKNDCFLWYCPLSHRFCCGGPVLEIILVSRAGVFCIGSHFPTPALVTAVSQGGQYSCQQNQSSISNFESFPLFCSHPSSDLPSHRIRNHF